MEAESAVPGAVGSSARARRCGGAGRTASRHGARDAVGSSARVRRYGDAGSTASHHDARDYGGGVGCSGAVGSSARVRRCGGAGSTASHHGVRDDGESVGCSGAAGSSARVRRCGGAGRTARRHGVHGRRKADNSIFFQCLEGILRPLSAVSSVYPQPQCFGDTSADPLDAIEVVSTRIVLSHLVLATGSHQHQPMLRASRHVACQPACQPVARACQRCVPASTACQPACQPASINKTSSPLDYYIIASPAASQRS